MVRIGLEGQIETEKALFGLTLSLRRKISPLRFFVGFFLLKNIVQMPHRKTVVIEALFFEAEPALIVFFLHTKQTTAPLPGN